VPAGFQSGNLKERRRLVDIGLDGKMELKLVFKKWVGGID